MLKAIVPNGAEQSTVPSVHFADPAGGPYGEADAGAFAPYRDEAVFESCDILVVADDQAFVVDSREGRFPFR